MQDGLLIRLRTKALSNQLAIAIGSSSSNEEVSIPSLAEGIIKTFQVEFPVDGRLQFFQCWNEFIEKVEKKVPRSELVKFVRARVNNLKPTDRHNKIAAIPISNFIDATFDRSLHKALLAAGRKPITHDWAQGQMIGSWRQTNPESPNIFFMLPSVEDEHSFFGLYEPTGWWKQNPIQIENIREMLSDKDLVLVDYYPHEAEGILHLYRLDTAGEKIVNFTKAGNDFDHYWARRGVSIRDVEPEVLIDKLLPYKDGEFTALDGFVGGMLIDAARLKPYDTFISYFSGDKDFVRRLEQSLHLHGVKIWRDDKEIEIGDSISGKIEEGLSQSYTFIIILSPEALERPWVREELRAAYALRLAGEFIILPVLHRECDIPPFLADYKYADFRDERRYQEQIELLERSIKNAVKRARGKK